MIQIPLNTVNMAVESSSGTEYEQAWARFERAVSGVICWA
jgi:hypothetical protein